MYQTRRGLLLSGSAVVASVGGCTTFLSTGTEMIDLVIANHTQDKQHFRIEALREDKEELDDAQVLDQDFTVQPRSGEDIETNRESAILERRKYLIRVQYEEGTGEVFTYHYYPDSTNEVWIRLYRDEDTGEKYVRMHN